MPATRLAPLRRVVGGGELHYVERQLPAGPDHWDRVPDTTTFSAAAADRLRIKCAAAEPAAAFRAGRSHSYRYELYECGHLRGEKGDIYGPTNAARRRCGSCRLGRPAEWPVGAEPLSADPVAATARRLRGALYTRIHRQRDLEYGPFAMEDALAAAGKFAVAWHAAPDPGAARADGPPRATDPHADGGKPAMWQFLGRCYGRHDEYTVADLLAGPWAACDRELVALTGRSAAAWLALCKGDREGDCGGDDVT